MRPVWGHVVNTMLEEVLRASPCAPPLRCPTPLPPSFKFLKPKRAGMPAPIIYTQTGACASPKMGRACLRLIFYNTCGACASLFTVPGVPAPYFLQYLWCLRLATHCARGACALFFYNTCGACAALRRVTS